MNETLARLRQALSAEYSIQREIGRGGMATVYLARDERQGRDVALKVLHPDLSIGTGAERFLREIRTTARLTHPHILPVHDSGKAGGLLYYTMPYVDGVSLRTRLDRGGALPIEDAIQTSLQIADALAYAHSQDLVHRDIKPENILYSASGHVWVSDFGLARAIHRAAGDTLTESGLAVGSPRYMSPEQASAERRVDSRSDIYSFACVMYEMMAGTPPFAGESIHQLIAQHIAAPRPSVMAARPDVPPHVSSALAKAMSKDPDDRFPNIADFTRALDPGGRSISYGRPFALSLRRHLRRIRPRTRVVAAVAALALAALGTIVWQSNIVGNQSAAELRERRVVVAPLDNRTGSPAFDHIGLMVADWSTAGLQSIRAIEVVPTTTAIEVSRFIAGRTATTHHRGDPVRAIADETGAGTVISGAVYRRGSRLLFRLQVTDVTHGTLVETLEDVDAPLDDPLQGVEEVRARLMGWFAGQADDRISAELSHGARPPAYSAYVAFSRGLDQYIASRWRPAAGEFLAAYASDSSFNSALLYASLCFSNLGEFARSDSLLKIVARHRDSLSEYEAAWLDYRRAYLAGDVSASLAAIRAAAQLAPDSKAAYNHSVTAFQAGHSAEALRVLRDMTPERGPMRGFIAYWDLLAAVYHSLGRYESERDIGLTEQRLYPDRIVAFMPAIRSLAVRGHADRLTRLLDEIEDLPTDPIGVDFGDALLEAGEELRAHGHPAAATLILDRAYRWFAANARTERDRWRGARAAYQLGRYDQAEALIGPLRLEDPSNAEYIELAGTIHARRRRTAAATAIADTLAQWDAPYQFGAAALGRARIAAVLGDRAGAVRELRAAFRQGKIHDLWLHRDADLALLRAYPPFAELARPRE